MLSFVAAWTKDESEKCKEKQYRNERQRNK